MNTIIYVDALNLYYGCLKDSPYKWLDLEKLFVRVLGDENNIITIKYFVAKVRALPNDPNAPHRQQIYLDALETHISPIRIEIYKGYFLPYRTKHMQNANPPPETVAIRYTEEKCSDVNFATHLINDAWRDIYDCAVVVSNDSDMMGGMKLVKEYHPHKIIGLVNPNLNSNVNKGLHEYADFNRKITIEDLKKSQLPDKIPNSNITKPQEWYRQKG